MKVYLIVIFISVAGWLEEFSLSSDAIVSCSIYADKYTVESPILHLGVVPLISNLSLAIYSSSSLLNPPRRRDNAVSVSVSSGCLTVR